MAKQEDVIILKVNTTDAVTSVGDLRNNIKELKKTLNETQTDSAEGWEKYQKTLEQLKLNQNALKDAMYATTGTFQDAINSAQGVGNSYNALVHHMAELKEEWRATNDEARRNELGKQIAEINQQLKDMDASVGNFQRNVGNYESGVSGLVEKFDNWGATLKQMPPTLGAAKESIGKVGETMQLVGKQPILGIIGLLAPIIMKITESLKENDTAMGAVKKVMEALQPVMDVVSGILEKIAEGFAHLVDWVLKLVGNGALDGFISKIAGVGNAILQYMLAPIKSAIAAVKGMGKIIGDVFKGEWGNIKTHAKETGQEIAEAYKQGFSFKANFESGQEAGTKFLEGARSQKAKEEAKEAGKELGKEMAKGMEEGLKLADWKNALSSGEGKNDARRDRRLTELQEIDAEIEAEMQRMTEEIDEMMLSQFDAFHDATKAKVKLTKEEHIMGMMAVADATSGLMSALADMYESDEKNAEKNAKKIKALRIASATIDMLNGAIGAFTQASATIPPPYGQIVGAASAASVIAMGIANINKIKSTNPGGGGSSASVSATPASVSAPNIETDLTSVRTITTASEEERLNRMAKEQRVYILQSDIEASGNASKARVQESSF